MKPNPVPAPPPVNVSMSWLVLVDINLPDPKDATKVAAYFVRKTPKHEAVTESDPQKCKIRIRRKDPSLPPGSTVTLNYTLVGPDADFEDPITFNEVSSTNSDPKGQKNFPVRKHKGKSLTVVNYLATEGTWNMGFSIKLKADGKVFSVDPEITNEDVRT